MSAPESDSMYADEQVDLMCAWSDYRKDYGVSRDPLGKEREFRAFREGFLAGRHGDQSGVLR